MTKNEIKAILQQNDAALDAVADILATNDQARTLVLQKMEDARVADLQVRKARLENVISQINDELSNL